MLLCKQTDFFIYKEIIMKCNFRLTSILVKSCLFTGRLEFKDASFECKSDTCDFRNIYTSFLNGEHVSGWSKELVFLDGEQFINGTLMSEKINSTNIHVSGLIDGVDSRNLVSKSGSHTITGRKTFNRLITAKDAKISGLVDGTIISSENVLLATGYQTIRGNLTFKDVRTSWLTAEKVNGKNITAFFEDLVLTDKRVTIIGEKTFPDTVVHQLTMIPGSRINGVDLADLWKNALWINGNQEITGNNL